MIDAAATGPEPRELAEAARRVLVPSQLRRKGLEHIEPLLLDPELERRLADAFTAVGPRAIDPALAVTLHEHAAAYAAQMPPGRAMLLCTAAVRPFLADFLLGSGIKIAVYAYGEVPPEMRLLPAGVIKEALTVPGGAGPG
jgi:flagellar biosynthesis component FlhA